MHHMQTRNGCRFLAPIMLAIFLLLPWTAPALALYEDAEAEAIRAVLMDQMAAWNQGDVDAFMQGYWKSDHLRFASGGTVTYGWQQTLDNYKRRYPDRAAMGVLSFSDLTIDILDEDDALVFGRWRLEGASDAPGGLYTLHVRKIEGTWKVVSDHTSAE